MTQKQKTHCRKGHAFTPDNTYWSGFRRECRTCKKLKGWKMAAPEHFDAPRSPAEIGEVTMILHKLCDIIDRATSNKEL